MLWSKAIQLSSDREKEIATTDAGARVAIDFLQHNNTGLYKKKLWVFP